MVVFIFIPILREHSVNKLEILTRRHLLWNLIWFCTVCLCPTKRTLGLYRDESIYAKWNFILISIGTVHFHFKGCLVVVFIFIQILLEHSETLIRCCILQCLVSVSTVFLCPIKRRLDLYGLASFSSQLIITIISLQIWIYLGSVVLNLSVLNNRFFSFFFACGYLYCCCKQLGPRSGLAECQTS